MLPMNHENGTRAVAGSLANDATAANLLIQFLARRDVLSLTPQLADLCVVCGSSVLATVYVAAEALQLGSISKILITGGKGHSTVYLYKAVQQHPIWHFISTEGRYEAEVLQDMFLALGLKQEQLLPLEVESLHCGGNAEYSKKLVDKIGLKPSRVLVLQDPTMQLRTHASFTKWWTDLGPNAIISYSPLQPALRVATDGNSLEYVPESIAASSTVPQEQLQQWVKQQQAHAAEGAGKPTPSTCSQATSAAGASSNGKDHSVASAAATSDSASISASQGVWEVDRFISLLLGEIPRLRDDQTGYGPKGKGFIDHVDVPHEVEAAHAWLTSRYPHLLRA